MAQPCAARRSGCLVTDVMGRNTEQGCAVISVSRRNLLKGFAAMPIAMGLTPLARATDLMVRYDIASPQGQQMLAIYADAVRQMQALGHENPLSWRWQWYTDFVDGAKHKSAEITRIFGTTAPTQ